MELNTFRNESTPLPSATVVLLRDAPAEGLQVFLLKRHGLSDVLGGVHVFPGGKVDPEDAQAAERLQLPAQQLHALLGEPDLPVAEAAALFVAAARELFEEAGVRVEVDALQPWSRWVTPVVSSFTRKRFDTRFFVAAMPPGQEAAPDTHETTEGVWLAPRAALQQYWQGAIDIAPPQLMSLAHLARHASVDSVLAAARGQAPPCIRPEPHGEGGVRVLCYPGDPGHPEPLRVLPGPTRLHWRNGRFEPDAGLAILLGD
jgi:8-oxo-dGTP pyrophosphatase MutT (NUDIX family)